MAKIVNNANFFKEPAPKQAAPAKQPEAPKPMAPKSVAVKPAAPKKQLPKVDLSPLILSPGVNSAVKDAIKLLQEQGYNHLAKAVEQYHTDACSELFSVAVVGEFSRGKSTFLNKLLGRKVLPEGNLPTTAMLTRIRYFEKDVIQCYDKDGKRYLSQPLTDAVWDDLVADNFGGMDPQGTALVGVNDPWLKAAGMELMDTPGAGDLEEARARIIGDALLRADGAIITVSALQALSLSEKAFIEQRLITRKTPFLMLIVTKLDMVPAGERLRLLDYVTSRLEQWGMNIPVFVPYDIELPENRYAQVMGVDKIKEQLLRWRCDPERTKLTESWLCAKVASTLAMAEQTLQEQKKLLTGKDEERLEKIRQKRALLEQARSAWNDLHIQMLMRGTQCQENLAQKAQEMAVTVTERLQYEANMSGNPRKWWTESYPYRVKVEMANLVNNLDGYSSRIISGDVRWLNSALEQQFKTHVTANPDTAVGKGAVGDLTRGTNIGMENVEKQRNLARVATVAVTIAGVLISAGLGGGLPMVVSMTIGTGSNLITEKVFKQKLEDQKAAIREAIGKNVPELVESTMSESDKRIQAIYNEVLQEAQKQEQVWLQTQEQAIANALQAPNEEVQKLEERISALQKLEKLLARV